MAIPKSLKVIDEKKASRILAKHLAAGTGEYEYGYGSDFIYEGKMTKCGHPRMEMIRTTTIGVRKVYEHGLVCG